MKKMLCIILTMLIIISTAVVGVSAVSGAYYEPKLYVPSEPAKEVGQNRYFFLMPDDWKNEFTESAGAYWWDGTDRCDASDGSGGTIKWPGYKINQYSSEQVTQTYIDDGKETFYTGTVWYVDVPVDVFNIIFTNSLDGGDESWDNYDEERFTLAKQTIDVGTEYYDPGESENYPEGTESFNNMIYVIDPTLISTSAVSAKVRFEGEWYYYHGGNKWDTALNPVYGGADGEKPGEPEDIVDPTDPIDPTQPIKPIDPMAPTKIVFEQPSDWKFVKQMYCHIWMIDDDGSVKWPSWKTKTEKMTDNGDGTWTYDVSKIGANVIDPDKGANYCVIFATDTGLQSYNLVMDAGCLGDTAYVSGYTYENPEDSNKTVQEARWRNSTLGPEKKILSTGEGVVGDTLPEGVTDEMLIAEWLICFYNDNTKTLFVDTLLEQLNVTGQAVYNEVVKLTEGYNNTEKESVRTTCAELLGLSKIPVYSENFIAICKNRSTGEELKGFMDFNSETGEAEYTFVNLAPGSYKFSVVDIDNLSTAGSTGIGIADNARNIQVVFSTVTGEILINVLKTSPIIDDLAELVDSLMTESDSNIYREEGQKAYLSALEYAQVVLKIENPTQEQIDTAYNNLKTADKDREVIGWVGKNSYLLGDTDASDDVNIIDATNVQMYVAKLAQPVYTKSFSDVDGDHRLSIKDATMIQCFCAKLFNNAGNTGTETFNYYFDEIYNI